MRDADRAGRSELAFDTLDRLGAAAVVEIDPVMDDMMDREPVGRFEIALRGACAVAKQRVVSIEPFEQNFRDRQRRIVRGGRVESIGSSGEGH